MSILYYNSWKAKYLIIERFPCVTTLIFGYSNLSIAETDLKIFNRISSDYYVQFGYKVIREIITKEEI